MRQPFLSPGQSTTGQNGESPNGTAAISPEAIHAALEKLLASPGFANAERLTRFLNFTINETLAGNGDRLKESLLGVEVFGRKPTYDPRIDAVVRTEAVKLRARLREYYETAGREDEIRIDLPKGGYVPQFVLQSQEKAEAEKAESPEKAHTPVPPQARPAAASTEEGQSSKKSWVAAVLVVVVLASAVLYSQRSRPPLRPASPNSVAVLPFIDLSPQKDQEYFCDGMTEELIDALTQTGGFRVVARTSSFAFKNQVQDSREIGRKLGVGALIEGSVRKDGQRLRVTAQLINVADGYHLWSETYERELKDVFTLQDEIANAIVKTLRQKLPQKIAQASIGTPSQRGEENLEAYEEYLKGLYHWNRWQTSEVEKAIPYFNRAIELDPNYAGAWAGLANSYTWLAFFGSAAPNQTMPKARAAAEKAISLNDNLAEAHTSLGYVRALYEWDWPSAQKEFMRALELNPNSAEAHFAYGVVYLTPRGYYSEAVTEVQRARDLDPLSLSINTYLGLVLQFNGQSKDAIDQYKRTLDLDPNFSEAHWSLFQRYCATNPAVALVELEKAKPGIPIERFDVSRGLLAAYQGHKEEALRLAKLSEERARTTYVSQETIAHIYVALDDPANTMKALERAYAERDGMLSYIRCSGIDRWLKGLDQYQDLLKRIGLDGPRPSKK